MKNNTIDALSWLDFSPIYQQLHKNFFFFVHKTDRQTVNKIPTKLTSFPVLCKTKKKTKTKKQNKKKTTTLDSRSFPTGLCLKR